MYLWWFRQYCSYRVLEALFDVAYQHVAQHLNKVRSAIVDIFHLVACFGEDHDVTMANIDKEYGTNMSKLITDEFYDGCIVLCSINDTYHASESMVGISGQKTLFNAMENKRYTMGNVTILL